MALFTYDPAEIIITIGGVPMAGFTDGTFCEVVRNEPTWNLVVGADGIATRGKTNNFSGTLTVTLKQSSPSNDVLSAFMIADELSNTGVIPILIKDLSGTSTFFSAQGWIAQFANATYGKDIQDRSWTISLAEIDMFVGSNSQTA
jgi:hypothetical protein